MAPGARAAAAAAGPLAPLGLPTTPALSNSQSSSLAPAHEAARDGNIAALRKMCQDKGKGVLNIKDGNGWMPVHMAARTHPSHPTRCRLAARLIPLRGLTCR